MKLYRSQLDQLISNQLFEISIEDLDLDVLKVVNDQIFSTVTVEFASNGYRIYGDIKCKTLEACDRCLNSYEHKKKIILDIILSNKIELINLLRLSSGCGRHWPDARGIYHNEVQYIYIYIYIL